MTRKLILIVLAALALWAFTPRQAEAQPRSGMPMMYEIPSQSAPATLARLIEQSLATDPTGNAIIPGSPCTTPLDILTGIRSAHPQIVIDSVANLPAYVRTLRVRTAAAAGMAGRYTMSRMLCAQPGTRVAGDELDMSGVVRAFSPGEVVLYDASQGVAVFAGDCTNIIGPPETPPPPPPAECAEIRFTAEADDTIVRYALYGQYANDACFGVRKEGEPTYFTAQGLGTDGTGFSPLPTRCPEHECDFREVSAFLGRELNQSGGFRVTPGVYTIRVSRAFAQSLETTAVLCRTRRDGRHSHGVGVQAGDYAVGSPRRATVPLTGRETWYYD